MPGTATAHNEPREVDPFNDAMTDEPSYFYGQVDVNPWTCVLETGTGKVPYDPQLHNGRRTSTCIEFSISPLDATQKLIQRDPLNWTPDFKGVIRPSIEALAEKIASIKGLTVGQFNSLREINEMWVSGEFVPRPDNKEGETWTTLKFLDVYPDELACRNAAGVESDEVPGFEPAQSQQSVANDQEREQMAAFLPALWSMSGNNYAKFLTLVAENPTSKFFNDTSPEVQKYQAPF